MCVCLCHLFLRRSLCRRTAPRLKTRLAQARLNDARIAAPGLNTHVTWARLNNTRTAVTGLNTRVAWTRLNDTRIAAAGLNTRIGLARLSVRVVATGLDMRVVTTGLDMSLVIPWVLMSLCISPEMIVSDGVLPPIVMASFPSMKMFQPNKITGQPDTTSSQIEIPVANPADVFAVNDDVTGGNHDRLLNNNRRP